MTPENGLELILWFQSWRGPVMELFGQVFHFLGSADFFMLILPVIYWCIDAPFGRRLGITFMFTVWQNTWLKALLKLPRPFMISNDVKNIIVETGYGLPSGHSQFTATLWGLIAFRVKKVWVTAAVAAFIILMGISRMVSGVHFLTDVLAGTALGLVWLGLYAWLEPKISTWLDQANLWAQLAITVAVAAVMLLVMPGLIAPTSPKWLGEVVPLDEQLEGIGVAVGVVLGFGVGFAFETRYIGFSTEGTLLKRVLRFAVGLIGVIILRFGLKAAFSPLEAFEISLVLRIARYALIGLWAAAGAPWVFVRTGLAERRYASE